MNISSNFYYTVLIIIYCLLFIYLFILLFIYLFVYVCQSFDPTLKEIMEALQGTRNDPYENYFTWNALRESFINWSK